jgi:hypothetical protein
MTRNGVAQSNAAVTTGPDRDWPADRSGGCRDDGYASGDCRPDEGARRQGSVYEIDKHVAVMCRVRPVSLRTLASQR